MFSLNRILRFWYRVLVVALPFLLAVFCLAVITEVLTHGGELFDYPFQPRFWLAVGLDMLPAILVSALVFWLAARFVSTVYRLDNPWEGVGFLRRSRFGSTRFGPWIRVKEGKITDNADGILARIGGPGNLIIENDSAVLLKSGGRLTRVVGPGYPELNPFEQIYDVVDLRPKRYRPYTVDAMTKEGIPISWDVEVHYQIDDGGREQKPNMLYPLSEEHVFRAATSKWKREPSFRHGQDMDWEGLIVISQAEGALRSILAQHSLDELIGFTTDGQLTARESIQEKLWQRLNETAPDVGAKILDVKLHNLQVENDAITQEWIRAWKTKWKSRSDYELAREQAERIYEYEIAKAEAQLWLLGDVCRAFQKLDYSQTVIPTAILLRLFAVLERAGLSSTSRVFVPGEALKALDQMKQLVAGVTDREELETKPEKESDIADT